MYKYDELRNMIKILNLDMAEVGHGYGKSRGLTGEVLKLVALSVTDRVLYPKEYDEKSKTGPGYSEVLDRNQPLLDVFKKFSPDFNWDCFRGRWGQLSMLLNRFTERELLHIPGMVHEYLLTVSAVKPNVPSNLSKRKYQGSYYTPIHVVSHMVRKALQYARPSNDINHIKIIDPACGGGSFLLEAWYALADMGISELAAADCIYGIDIDDTAIGLSVFLLTVAVWAKSAQTTDPEMIKTSWEKRVITGNFLTGLNFNQDAAGEFSLPLAVNWQTQFPDVFRPKNQGDEPGFDLVIGNPPYVSNKLIEVREKKYYQNQYKSAKGQFDLSVPFIEQGLNVLKTGGFLSYITSNKFLAADYGKDIRLMLLERNRLLEITDVSMLSSFANTAAYPVIATVCKKWPSAQETVKLSLVSEWQQVEHSTPVPVEQGFFMVGRDQLISTRLDNAILPIIKRLGAFAGSIPRSKIKCGLAVSGFNKWIVKNPHLGENLFKFIQAGHIKPYYLEKPDFIEPGHFSAAKADKFKGPKLVVPGIASNLQAAIDYSDSILGRVYYIKQTDIDIDINILVVLLNSQVLNFYYKVIYWAVHLAGGYLRFNSGYLANLPIPALSGNCAAKECENGELGEKIGEIGRILSGMQLGDELPETTVCRADALVFSLYGLTRQEARVIMQFNGLEKAKQETIIEIMEEVEFWKKKRSKAN